MIFSAKESVYKAVYPMLRRILEFHEVQLDLSVSIPNRTGHFTARLPHGAQLPGALRWTPELIVTNCWIDALDCA